MLLHSNRRTDAVMLEALLSVDPDNPLNAKVMKGLLGGRVKGAWKNTQENCFVLLALDKFFKIYEKDEPDFLATIWLGNGCAGDHKFKGRTAETYQVEIPMSYVMQVDMQNLIIEKSGIGRLYYRLGIKYVPENLEIKADDFGFVVNRYYRGLDNTSDVVQTVDKETGEEVWKVKLGTRVKIRITMKNVSRRYHVALVDPLPAGFEVLNTALKGTEMNPEDNEKNWSDSWKQHQNLRDERAEAFTTELYEGNHSFTYCARATTAGEFVVPPAKAEEMYSPEVFGRSSSSKVIIS